MWTARNVCDLYPFGAWPPTLAPYCIQGMGPIDWSPPNLVPGDPVYGYRDEQAAKEPVNSTQAAEQALPVSGLGQLDSNTIWTIQVFLNEELKALRLPQVRMDGVVDSATCQALLRILQHVKSGGKVDPTFAELMRDHGAAMDAACRQFVTGAAPPPPPPSQTTPPPTVISAFPLTPLPGPGAPAADEFELEKCFISFGDRSEIITSIQNQINAKLAEEGYEAIPVSGEWDAKTCGAIFFLKGRFSPQPIPPCPYYEVPLECPSVAEPKKKGAKVSTAWIAGGLVAAGAVGLVAYLATKKGT